MARSVAAVSVLLALSVPASAFAASATVTALTSPTHPAGEWVSSADATFEWSHAIDWRGAQISNTTDTPDWASRVKIVGDLAYVADAFGGVQVFDIANPGAPVRRGGYNTVGYTMDIAVSGTIAYVADMDRFTVLDVSNPAAPVWRGEWYGRGANAVAVSGTHAYVAYSSYGFDGLRVFDISNPAAPTPIVTLATPGPARDIDISGTNVYIADGHRGLRVIDVSNPAAPVPLGALDPNVGAASGVTISGTTAYVADHVFGLRIIDVSNPAAPVLRSDYAAGWSEDVAVSGTTAYVVNGGSGLRVLDVSNPAAPVLRTSVDTPDYACGVGVFGGFAFVGDGGTGLQAVDVSSPAAPSLLGGLDTPGSAMNVAVAGTTAYVADFDRGLRIVDIANPGSPQTIGALDTPGTAWGVAVSGTTAYVADAGNGLMVIDVSNPAAPALLGTFAAPYSYRVAVSGTTAYVVDGVGLQAVDVSNPAAPAPLGTIATPSSTIDVAVAGNLAYVANYDLGLQIVDVSNPAALTLRGRCDTTAAYGVAVSGSKAYVADEAQGLRIIDVSNPDAPVLSGSYNTPGLAYGVAVSGTTVGVADSGVLRVVDASNSATPVEIGAYDTPGSAEGLAMAGNVAYVADGAAGLQAVAAGVPAVSYSYSISAAAGTIPDAIAEGSTASASFAGLADGTWYFHVRPIMNGGARVTQHLAVRVDTAVDPGASFSLPPGGYASPVLVAVSNSDSLSGAGPVLVTVDGIGAPNPFTITGEGPHTVEVEAYDLAGNVTPATAVYTIDTTPPTVADDSSSAWRSSDVTVTISAEDEGSGVDSIDWRVVSPGGATSTGTTTAITREIAVADEGVSTIEYAAVDALGNRCATETATVRIDRTPPTVLAVPTHGIPSGMWVRADAHDVWLSFSDALSGAQGFVSVDGRAYEPIESASFARTIGLGPHTFSYFARDEAGNESERGIYSFGLDPYAPTAQISVPPEGVWVNGPVYAGISGHSGVASLGKVVADVEGQGTFEFASPGTLALTGEGKIDIACQAFNLTVVGDGLGGYISSPGGPVASVSVWIDNTAPVTSAAFPGGWRNAPVVVELDAVDPPSDADGSSSGVMRTLSDRPLLVTEEGTTTVVYWSEDAVGNVETPKTASVRIDLTAPRASDDAPTGWVTGDTTVTVSATDALSGASRMEWVVTSPGGAVSTGSAAGVEHELAVRAEGVTTIEYAAIDVAGNRCATETASVRIDRTAPSTTASHADGWSSAPVVVTLTPGDAHSGVASSWYRIGGGPAIRYEGPFAVPNAGETTVSFWSIDAVGNTEAEDTTVVRRDTGAPAASDDAPAGWRSSEVTVTLSASDDRAGVAAIDWRTVAPDGVSAAGTIAADAQELRVSAEGTTTIEYSARDVAGNRCATETASVRIDRTAPSVSVSAHPGEGSATLVVNAEDALSGVSGVWCAIDGGPAVATNTVRLETYGVHLVEYWAADAAGNESGHETFTVSVTATSTAFVGIEGRDRYATAAEASKRTFPAGAGTVVIATGENWPDAIGGAALAGVHDAPMLLTHTATLPDVVAGEISRLRPSQVFILGGVKSISEDVEARVRSLLAPGASLERLWGADRYGTANAVALRVAADAEPFAGTAFLATGRDFPDALAASPLATALARPLYLCGRDGISAGTLAAIQQAGVTRVVVLGGDSVVPSQAERQLDAGGIAHTRIAGTDRYETAVRVAESGVAAGLTWDRAALGRGSAFPDALSGGVMQGHDCAVLLLAPRDTLPPSVAAALAANRAVIGEFRFLGGTAALSEPVRAEVKRLLQ